MLSELKKLRDRYPDPKLNERFVLECTRDELNALIAAVEFQEAAEAFNVGDICPDAETHEAMRAYRAAKGESDE